MLSTCLTETYFSQCSVASHGGGHFLRRLSANLGCSGEGFLWRRCLGFPRSGAGIGTRRLEGPLCPRGRSHSRSHFLPNCLPSLQIKHTLVKKKEKKKDQTSNSFIKKSKKCGNIIFSQQFGIAVTQSKQSMKEFIPTKEMPLTIEVLIICYF